MRSLTVARFLVCIVAVLWPLEVAAAIPFTSYTFLALAVAALFATTAYSVGVHGKLSVPFEFLWPTLALAVFCIWDWQSGGAPVQVTLERLGALGLFVCVAHTARTDGILRASILFSCIGGGAALLAAAVAPRLGWMPTTYASPWGVEFPLAFGVLSGFEVSLVTGAFALFVSRSRLFEPSIRAAGLFLLLGSVALVIGKTVQGVRATEVSLAGPALERGVISWVALALAAWLWVRVLAKVTVSARAGRNAYWLLGIAVTAALILVVGMRIPEVRLRHGFLLGLLAASALPRREDAVAIRLPAYIGAVVACASLVVLANVFGRTMHVNDERGYEAFARGEFARGDFDALLRRMDRVEAFHPSEPGVYYWRARVALERDNIEKAAVAYARAIQPYDGPALESTPTEEQTDAFLVMMRDRIAYEVNPERTPAYVRMLTARNETGAARAYLLAHVSNGLYLEWEAPRGPFEEAVSVITGDVTRLDGFEGLEASRLRLTLMNWGAAEHTAPELPGGPVVVVAQRWAERCELLVFRGDSSTEPAQERLPADWNRAEALPETDWRFGGPSDDYFWTATLHSLDGDATPLADVRHARDGRIFLDWETLATERMPYRPAILVVLPADG